MKRISAKKLKDVLDKHNKWLSDKEGGHRADLSYSNLSEANLFATNLPGADLSGANLSGAKLRYANLSEANLSNADLSGASLSLASLSLANLSGANLRYANLSGANLFGTNLLYFNHERDGAVYIGLDNIQIGCLSHTIKHWVDNFEKIGIEYRYTAEQIEKYGEFIKKCEMDYNSTKVCK